MGNNQPITLVIPFSSPDFVETASTRRVFLAEGPLQILAYHKYGKCNGLSDTARWVQRSSGGAMQFGPPKERRSRIITIELQYANLVARPCRTCFDYSEDLLEKIQEIKAEPLVLEMDIERYLEFLLSGESLPFRGTSSPQDQDRIVYLSEDMLYHVYPECKYAFSITVLESQAKLVAPPCRWCLERLREELIFKEDPDYILKLIREAE